MPALKTYDLFISHAWVYDEDYYRLVKWLDDTPNFRWRNYSVPEHDPLDANNTKKLEAALARQVRPVNAVLILAGMYVAYREWIQYEIDLAQHYNKPIIGVVPRGAERVPQRVQDVAEEIVRWNSDSIVAAIRTFSL